MSNAPDQHIWNEGCDPRRTLAEPYLREGRKLDLPNDLAGIMPRFLLVTVQNRLTRMFSEEVQGSSQPDRPDNVRRFIPGSRNRRALSPPDHH